MKCPVSEFCTFPGGKNTQIITKLWEPLEKFLSVNDFLSVLRLS